MVGKHSISRCCCDEEPGGCLVFDDRETDPGYSICSGSWTVDQTAGAYITKSSNAKLIFSDTISTGQKWRFKVSVTIEKTIPPFVGDAIVKLFGANDNCTDGIALVLTVNYTGSFYDSGSVVLNDVSSNAVISTETYDLEICYDGTTVTATWYNPFESRITTRTFTPTSGYFGFGTGTLEADMQIIFTNPYLEIARGDPCPRCTLSCCKGPVPDEMEVTFTGYPVKWLLSSFPYTCNGSGFLEEIWYDLTPLNATHLLSVYDAAAGSCEWTTDVTIDVYRRRCEAFVITEGITETIDVNIHATGNIITLTIPRTPIFAAPKRIRYMYVGEPFVCEDQCDPLDLIFLDILGGEMFPNTTATFNTVCPAMPASGYGIPKDIPHAPQPKFDDLPEEISSWLTRPELLSKKSSAPSESPLTKDADAQT